jgi:hypothetical protein
VESGSPLLGLHYRHFRRCFQHQRQINQRLGLDEKPQNRLIHRRIREVGLRAALVNGGYLAVGPILLSPWRFKLIFNSYSLYPPRKPLILLD